MENKITHPRYGKEIIIKVEKAEVGYWLTIRFEEIGEKRMLSLVNPLNKTK